MEAWVELGLVTEAELAPLHASCDRLYGHSNLGSVKWASGLANFLNPRLRGWQTQAWGKGPQGRPSAVEVITYGLSRHCRNCEARAHHEDQARLKHPRPPMAWHKHTFIDLEHHGQ